MDILELWELTYLVLSVVLWLSIWGRPPMPSKESATFQQLAKRIKSQRRIFGAAMMLVLYKLWDIPLARGDRLEIVLAIIFASLFLALGFHQLWRARQCVRLQRELVDGQSSPEREVGK